MGAAALAAAIAILVTIVLPAEYGVDPTRIGSVFGLTEMGRIKMQLAEEAAAEDAPQAEEAAVAVATPEPAPATDPVVEVATPTEIDEAAPVEPSAPEWRDEVTFTLAADAASEYKLVMKEGETATFEWFTDGAKANFDTHGDRPGLNYHNYEKGSLARQESTLTAAFDGSHGWFWRNRSGAPLTITLRTRGDYVEMKKVL
ncbi:MAG: transmembrane anchor protein [Parvularculaceae bacterium]